MYYLSSCKIIIVIVTLVDELFYLPWKRDTLHSYVRFFSNTNDLSLKTGINPLPLGFG